MLAVVITIVGAACGVKSPTTPSPVRPPSADAQAIMGSARLNANQIVTWFRTRQPQPAGTYTATVPLETLVQLYLDEAAAERVTGDIAFVQSVVETGWFRFTGLVPPSANNFGGIGATDTNPAPATFPDARTGVRAQIQHLRAYADPAATACTSPPLANPCVDPRFNLVVPKGRAPNWNDLGNGNWAAASTYATTILTLYDEARSFNGQR